MKKLLVVIGLSMACVGVYGAQDRSIFQVPQALKECKTSEDVYDLLKKMEDDALWGLKKAYNVDDSSWNKMRGVQAQFEELLHEKLQWKPIYARNFCKTRSECGNISEFVDKCMKSFGINNLEAINWNFNLEVTKEMASMGAWGISFINVEKIKHDLLPGIHVSDQLLKEENEHILINVMYHELVHILEMHSIKDACLRTMFKNLKCNVGEILTSSGYTTYRATHEIIAELLPYVLDKEMCKQYFKQPFVDNSNHSGPIHLNTVEKKAWLEVIWNTIHEPKLQEDIFKTVPSLPSSYNLMGLGLVVGIGALVGYHLMK